MGCRVQGLGFRVQGLGFREQGLGFRVQGSGFFLSMCVPRLIHISGVTHSCV